MKYKISVIVPVYNTEKYLKKCLDSLINQTLKDIEIIVINDGSTDSSSQIAHEYSNNYDNVVMYDRKNCGLSETRNFGISKANGEYIAFVDSDDYIEKNIYEKCYEYLQQNNLDIVMFDYFIDSGKKITKRKLEFFDKIEDMYLYNLPNVWNKVIKKSLWNEYNLKFKKDIWYEDLCLLPSLYIYTKKIGYLEMYGYYYVIRDNSITHIKTYNSHCLDIITALDSLYELFNNYGLEHKLLPIFITEGIYFGTQSCAEFNVKCDYDKIICYIERVFPEWKKHVKEIKFNRIKKIYLLTANNFKIIRTLVKIRKILSI